MEDIGLQWNPKKCNVLNVRRGVPVDIPEGFKSGETLINSLKEDTTYRFLLTDLRDIDRQARKIVCESGGRHPLGLKATFYLPRALAGRGMRSVEEECKMTKIKSAIKLYSNEDPTMRLVRAFEENVIHQGHQSLVKEAREFAEELGFTLDLSFPHPKCRDNTDGADVPRDKIKRHLKKAAME